MEYKEVKAANLRSAANACSCNGNHALLAMFAIDERIINNSYAIYCIFESPEAGKFQTIKAVLPESEPLVFPSLVPVIPAAAWYEREIHDLFGIKPIDHPDIRRLVLHENWPNGIYPMRKDIPKDICIAEASESFPIPRVSGEGVFEVPVGPIHAGIIEPGHFRFSQAGENMIQLEAKLFFTHRGIEKTVEGMAVNEAILTAERICGACSVSHALSFSHAVERMSGTQVSKRAGWIRILIAELERLYNHVGDTGNLCAGVGFAVGISNGTRLKESLMRLNEVLTGNRFLRGMVIPGGVSMDIDVSMQDMVYGTLLTLEDEFKELISILQDNDTFLDRINTTGILPHSAAVDLAAVGVAARASGIAKDMRKDYPYDDYDKLDFKVPVYKSGDVAARLWVRADEVFQSIRIIRQVIELLKNDDSKQLNVPLSDMKPYSMGWGWSESARGGNLHFVMMGEKNKIYRYFVRSASYANWPAVGIAVPGNIIPDFPLINKSFELCYACIDR